MVHIWHIGQKGHIRFATHRRNNQNTKREQEGHIEHAEHINKRSTSNNMDTYSKTNQ